MTGMVHTVLGRVAPDDLGVTLPHEHILSTLEALLEEPRDEAEARLLEEPLTAANRPAVRAAPHGNRANLLFDDEDLAVRELCLFRDAGGSTVVDQTLPDIGRDLAGLARIARRTGLHIVAGCGFYLDRTHAAAVAESTVEELAERMVAELNSDAADGIPCGVLGEIGLTSPMTAAERRVLRAVAIAQRETGAPVSIHTQAPDAQGLQALDLLEAGGVDPERVAIAHVDTDIDPAYQSALAARGAFVEYDLFGWGEIAATAEHSIPSDRQRVAGVARLLDAGCRDQVLLSQDVVTRMQLAEYGGSGYAHIARDLPPLFAEYAVAGDELRRLMTANPARWLTWR
jgi:phosphotriesterase-related protein